MRGAVRFAVETLLLILLAGGMLIAVVAIARQFDDEKIQYFLIGYYVAIHHDLARWIWKRLRIEKKSTA